MRALALILLAAAGPIEVFERYVDRAAQKAELARSPVVRVSAHRDRRAWVRPPFPIIWIDVDYLNTGERADLCRTAYHEVCHLWLHERNWRDAADHRDVKACMKTLGAWRCLYLERIHPWDEW